MHVITIKPTRSSNTVIITFSDRSVLPFSVDEFVKMGIKKYSDLDSRLLNQIYQKSIEHQLWEYSLRQLSMISQPEKIIGQKLKNYCRKIFLLGNIKNDSIDTQLIITKILSRLRDRGLINNSVYAAGFVRKSYNKSRRRIIMELNQKGVSPSDQNLAVSALNDKDKILNFFKKKKYTRENFLDWKEKNKIIAAFYRRGFSLSDIKSVIDDLIKNG